MSEKDKSSSLKFTLYERFAGLVYPQLFGFALAGFAPRLLDRQVIRTTFNHGLQLTSSLFSFLLVVGIFLVSSFGFSGNQAEKTEIKDFANALNIFTMALKVTFGVLLLSFALSVLSEFEVSTNFQAFAEENNRYWLGGFFGLVFSSVWFSYLFIQESIDAVLSKYEFLQTRTFSQWLCEKFSDHEEGD